MREIRKYSEAFKMKVVRELETGKIPSCSKARDLYGIGSYATVPNWVRAYGKNQLLGKVVRVENMDEISELKKLKERVRQLESALADATIREAVERSVLEIVCEKAGIDDLEGFKKKHGGILPTERSKQQKKRKG